MATTEEGKRRAEALVPQFQFERVLNQGKPAMNEPPNAVDSLVSLV